MAKSKMCIKVLYFLLIVDTNNLIRCCLGEAYHVAVMEFAVNSNYSQSTHDILEENTKNYLNLVEDITKNQSQELDLIIFPESTLTPYVSFSDTAAQLPNSSDIVLCNSTDDKYLTFLKNISCAAVHHNTTIVINLTEKEIDCSDSKEIFYNTNIALAPNGTIIARYRKWNLFGERGKSKPTTLDLPVITIKNTTFGMMTCFDIQFGVPTFNLTKEKGLQNIIFPLNWISELPYLTALQTQQMWAQELDVILLASGASLPTSGAGGSGIFLGDRGPLESVILSQKGTRVLIQTVYTEMDKHNISYKENNIDSIDSLAASMDDFYMLVDPSIKDHNSVVLNATEGTTSLTVCHGEETNVLCCDFNISISGNRNGTSQAYTYHLVAFNGIRTYSGLYYGGVETCGVIACLNGSVASCGQRFHNYSSIVWPLTFHAISIKGNFTMSAQRIQYPSTLLSSIYPLPIQEYTWEKTEANATITRKLTLEKPQTRLLTFGIFGRDFERDWDPIRNNTATGNDASTIRVSCLLWLINWFVIILSNKSNLR